MTIVPMRSSTIYLSLALGSLLLALASCASKLSAPMAAIEDFCSDPRILVEMQHQDPKLEMGQPWCKASRVSFRRDEEIVDIPVAQVLRGYTNSSDAIAIVTDSIIRLPENRLVNLGPMAPVPFKERLDGYLMAVLTMQPPVARPMTYQFDRFYTAILERTKRGYCMSYEMKPPFVGQLSQCSGTTNFSGDGSYLPGSTTWKDAQKIACRAKDRSPSSCSIFSMGLVADPKGEAFYVVELLVDGRCLYYVVEAMTGIPSLRGQRSPDEPNIPFEKLLEGA